MSDRFPKRIICLTEETTETLYLLGEQHRIVGISGYTVRPPQARKEKPIVSAFISAKIDKILALKPDLVLGFSDLQANIAADLIRHGIPVHIFNQRSVEQIMDMMIQLGSLVGAYEKTKEWVEKKEQQLSELKIHSQNLPKRPVVYFEEWDNPMITGIQWVSEIIEIAGGKECFPEYSKEPLGKNRIIPDPKEVVRRAPDIIIGSWCGKKFRPQLVAEREGWQEIPAVKNNQLFEIKSAYILQPGPAALTEGLAQMQKIITQWMTSNNPS